MMSYPEFKSFMFTEFYYNYSFENKDLPKSREQAAEMIMKEFKANAKGKFIISDADYNRLKNLKRDRREADWIGTDRATDVTFKKRNDN